MRKYLFLALGFSLCLLAASCKSKKVMVEQAEPVPAAQTDEAEDMQKEISGAKVETVDEGLKVTFDANILFNLNSSYLTGNAHQQLQELVSALKNYTYSAIRIEGHTDSSGEADYNQWLSERRAGSVKDYLVSQGIPAAKMTTMGLGEANPVASNDNPEGMAQNRRVEVIISQ